jgi:hypothetical protein
MVKNPHQAEVASQINYLQALFEDNFSFSKLPQEMKDNKDFVLKALDVIKVSQSIAMWGLSELLRSDKEVMLKMIDKYPQSIRVASDDLRKDKEVALAAYKKSHESLDYFHSSLIDEIDDMCFENLSQVTQYLKASVLEQALRKDLSSNNKIIRKPNL